MLRKKNYISHIVVTILAITLFAYTALPAFATEEPSSELVISEEQVAQDAVSEEEIVSREDEESTATTTTTVDEPVATEQEEETTELEATVDTREIVTLRDKDAFYKDLEISNDTLVPILSLGAEEESLLIEALSSSSTIQTSITEISEDTTIDVVLDVYNSTLSITNLFHPTQSAVHLQVGESLLIHVISLGQDETDASKKIYGLWPEFREEKVCTDEDTENTEEISLFASVPATPVYFTGTGHIIANYPSSGHWSPGGIYYPHPLTNVFTVELDTPYGFDTITMWCLDPGVNSPVVGGYYYRTAHFYYQYLDTSTNEYVFLVEMDFPAGYQDVGEGYFRVPAPTGSLQIVKDSTNPEVTNNNPNYSLEGAVFRIWTDTWSTQTSPTDAQGRTNVIENLWPGWYNVQEIVAPKGYQLDPNPRLVYVDNEINVGITTYRFADKPAGDPEPMFVQKYDTTTGEAYGVDDPTGASLAGAQFTWQYWPEYYSSAEEACASGDPLKTWVVQTKITGMALLSNSYLVPGSDELYTTSTGYPMIPYGTVIIQETKPALGYLLPENPPVYVMQIMQDQDSKVMRTLTRDGEPVANINELNAIEVAEDARVVTVEKYDTDTEAPIPNTEFTLYRESAEGAGDWQAVATKTTDENGKLTFSPVAVGSYKLEETRPNPAYAEASESGQEPRLFIITEDSTGELQVFYNQAIQISCEVLKDTINITSAAFKTDDADYLQINNIASEEYAYRVSFRSTSNVRADEFTVIDPMENSQSGQVCLTQLWTPVVYGDTDGYFNLWYRTNLTDPTARMQNADAMQSNPYNPNNPENTQVFTSTGWRVWAESLSTTSVTQLTVDELGLRDGEYITGVRYEYGSVEVGFTTNNGPINTQQTWKPDLDWSPTLLANRENSAAHSFEENSSMPLAQQLDQATQATGLYPAYYLVICPEGITPPEEIRSSASAHIARNLVLTDEDTDHVVTTVIAPFFTEFPEIERSEFDAHFGDTRRVGLPQTGDTNYMLLTLCAGIAATSFALLVVALRRRTLYRQPSTGTPTKTTARRS